MFQVNQNSLLVKLFYKVIFSATKLLKCKKKPHNFWINTRQNLNHQACKNQQILIFEKLKILVQVKKKIKIIILLMSEIEDILNLKIVSALTCML